MAARRIAHMDKNTVSVVLITKNEEKKIRRCLDSVKPLASEMIIIDDCSEDNTPVIAKEEYGAKVIINRSNGNFDRQRNLGIETAAGEWILQMDSDEEMLPETISEIKRALTECEGFSAFRLTRRDCVFGVPLRYCGNEKAVKLFKKDKCRYTGSKIHETLHVDGVTGDIPGQINHYNFDSIKEVIDRWNFYTDVESAAFVKQGNVPDIRSFKKRLIYKSVKLFYKHYIKNRGYKDGIYGLIWSVLHVISPLLFWLKVLERKIKDTRA